MLEKRRAADLADTRLALLARLSARQAQDVALVVSQAPFDIESREREIANDVIGVAQFCALGT